MSNGKRKIIMGNKTVTPVTTKHCPFLLSTLLCATDTWGEVRSSFLTVGAICACLAKTLAFRPGENRLAVVGAGSTLAGIKLIQVLQEGLPKVSPLCDSTWDPPNQINDGQHLDKCTQTEMWHQLFVGKLLFCFVLFLISCMWNEDISVLRDLTLLSTTEGLSRTDLAQFLKAVWSGAEPCLSQAKAAASLARPPCTIEKDFSDAWMNEPGWKECLRYKQS